MKIIIYISLFILFDMCDKQDDAEMDSLTGKWLLTSIEEKTTGLITTYPDSFIDDIHIEFGQDSSVCLDACGDKCFGSGNYFIYNNDLIIEDFSWIEPGFCEWSELVIKSLRHSTQYSISGSTLKIIVEDEGINNLILKKVP